MPRGDGTGPRRTGGRGTANCAGGQNRSGAKTLSGKNAAGRGQCGWFNASDLAARPAEKTENRLLMEQADALRRQLDEIESKLNKSKNR